MELVEKLASSRHELDLGRRELLHVSELLADDAFIYRFLRKSKQDLEKARVSILSHIDWRLDASIPSRDIASLPKRSREYLDQGLFFFISRDKANQPLAVLNLDRYIPSSIPSDIDDLRYFLIFFLEIARKYINAINYDEGRNITSFSVLLDLKSVGMSNLSYDLFPTFYDLFHSHFPRIIRFLQV